MHRQLRRLSSSTHGRVLHIPDLLHREIFGVLLVVLLRTKAAAESVQHRRRGWLWLRATRLGNAVWYWRFLCGRNAAFERARTSVDFISVDLRSAALHRVDDSGGLDDCRRGYRATNRRRRDAAMDSRRNRGVAPGGFTVDLIYV